MYLGLCNTLNLTSIFYEVSKEQASLIHIEEVDIFDDAKNSSDYYQMHVTSIMPTISKIYESCVVEKIDENLAFNDNQFRLVKNCGTGSALPVRNVYGRQEVKYRSAH